MTGDDLMAMPCLYMSDEHLKKIAPDEPVFVIRAQDLAAPAAVEAWCAIAAQLGAPPEKIAHAKLHAEAMRRWTGAKKVPD